MLAVFSSLGIHDTCVLCLRVIVLTAALLCILQIVDTWALNLGLLSSASGVEEWTRLADMPDNGRNHQVQSLSLPLLFSSLI